MKMAKPGIYALKAGNPCGSVPGKKKKVKPMKKGGPKEYAAGFAGRKIRSKGKGRGLKRGRGRGPIGLPAGY